MDARIRHRRIVFAAAVFAAVAGAVVLYLFAPSDHRFYPRCFLYAVTGLACPGCGSLRAIHTLLHGDIAAAFRLNALLLTIAPVFAVAVVARRKLTFSDVRPFWIWLLFWAVVLFGVLRNLPFAPFSWLKP